MPKERGFNDSSRLRPHSCSPWFLRSPRRRARRSFLRAQEPCWNATSPARISPICCWMHRARCWPSDGLRRAGLSRFSRQALSSLVAYGEQHGGQFPTVRCMGTQSRCWLPAGHGSLGLEEAIAQSCNAYFLELAAGLDRRRAAETFARYGLAGPPAGAATESLVGLGSAWKESPLALARAYLQLAKEQQSAVQGRIVKGMLGSAARGTAREVDAALGKDAALAKTGTAACSHTPRGAADGFTLVLYPAAQPRLLLLVRVHGVTGAESAKVAGAMLHALGAGER